MAALLRDWKGIIHAETLEGYKSKWAKFCSDWEPEQPGIYTLASSIQSTNIYLDIVHYLRDQWLQRRPQFLHCYTRRYRNFGLRASSTSESGHSQLKSYLDNRMADLYLLYSKTKELVDDKEKQYRAKAAQEARKRRHKERNNPLLEELALKVSFRALDLLTKQFCLAKTARLNKARLGTSSIGTCSEAFTQQYGLPCKHKIYSILQTEGTGVDAKVTPTRALQMAEIDEFWYLERSLVSKYLLFG